MSLKLFVALFVFWFTMGFGMAAELPIIYGEVSIGASAHPVPSPGNDPPHCPLRKLRHLSGGMLPGPAAADLRIDGSDPIFPGLSQVLVSIDLSPPGHIPIVAS
jgi:hypothetical protein